MPTIPQSSEGERLLLHHLEAVRLFALPTPLPFVEAIRRNQAAPMLEKFPERWFLGDMLDLLKKSKEGRMWNKKWYEKVNTDQNLTSELGI
jgi:hypothetical protein